MKKNKNSYEVLEAEVAKLKEENRHLKDERDELKYMLNDMHSVVDAANDDFFNEMSRLCGCIEIEGTRITAAYQDLVGIEDLCKAGIPIKTAQGTGGGISIMDGYRMDRTILSSKDMQMILAGLRSLDSVSGSRYYSQLMEKIQTGSSEFISGRDSMLIDLSSWYKGSLAPKIEVIQSAIENRRIIRFKYYAPSGESNRRVEPYYLVFQWSSWYVWGVVFRT